MSPARRHEFESCGTMTPDLPLLSKFPGEVPHYKEVLEKQLPVGPLDAIFRDEKNFIPGSLMFNLDFWENEILVGHPLKEDCLKWLQGVKIEYFLREYTTTTFRGRSVEGKYC